MTIRVTSYTKEKLISGCDLIVDGRMQFNSITIRKDSGGGLLVEFNLDGRAVMWMPSQMPNFNAGDTLNICDILGSLEFTLS